MPRSTISKGRFVAAARCPTKLFYQCNPELYLDAGADNDFLKALAEGGFQVGELAKLSFPGGIDHSGLTADESWKQLVLQIAAAQAGQRLVFFEPTIRSGRLLARADVLEFQDGTFWLHEVKSKSGRDGLSGDESEGEDSEEADPALGVMTQKTRNGRPWIRGGWWPYVVDVTFQAHVIERAFERDGRRPRVHADLIVANKSAVASRDGINQLFRLVRDPKTGRMSAETRAGTTAADVGAPLLMSMDIVAGRKHLLEFERFPGDRSFVEYVDWLEGLVDRNEKAPPTLRSHCKGCEFRVKPEALVGTPLKSGFKECWLEASDLTEAQIDRDPLLLEIWKWRADDRDPYLARGVYRVGDLDPQAVISKSEARRRLKGSAKNSNAGLEAPLTESARREIQVRWVREARKDPYVQRRGLDACIEALRWPLNLIDFETARVAIPFHRGQRPYGQIAFQFSHHLMYEDGRIEHQSQFLETTPGVFPNFAFVRALRQALGDDGGSVLMFHIHERSVLNDVSRQLESSAESDRNELIGWIDSLTREGAPRELVDLCRWVRDWWYHPGTRGSNSLKAILPVVLDAGGRFESLYSKPIYGAEGGIRSLNFRNHQWICRDPGTGRVLDPYKTLAPVFPESDPFAGAVPAWDKRLFQFNEINQGGAAMQAYARMQFTEMLPAERRAMEQALLRYCELDTFAMGILLEHLKG